MEPTAQECFTYGKKTSNIRHDMSKAIHDFEGAEAFRMLPGYILQMLIRDKYGRDVSKETAIIIGEHMNSLSMWVLLRSLCVLTWARLSGTPNTSEYWKLLFSMRYFGFEKTYQNICTNVFMLDNQVSFYIDASVHCSCHAILGNDIESHVKHKISHYAIIRCLYCNRGVKCGELSEHMDNVCMSIPATCGSCYMEYKTCASNKAIGHNLLTCRTEVLKQFINHWGSLKVSEHDKMHGIFSDFSTQIGCAYDREETKRVKMHAYDKPVWRARIREHSVVHEISLVSYAHVCIKCVEFKIVPI
jgi:hypothetical protein